MELEALSVDIGNDLPFLRRLARHVGRTEFDRTGGEAALGEPMWKDFEETNAKQRERSLGFRDACKLKQAALCARSAKMCAKAISEWLLRLYTL